MFFKCALIIHAYHTSYDTFFVIKLKIYTHPFRYIFHTHSFFHFFTSFWSSNYSFIHHTTIISHIQLYLDGGVKRGGMYFGPSFLRSLKLFSNSIGPTFLFLLVRTCDGCIGCTSFSALFP